jgi:hypothetical protein
MINSSDACGPWTEKEQEKVDAWIEEPNMARWVMYFLEDPQRISDYMAANCSTATVGGGSPIEKLRTDDFGWYLGKASRFLLNVADGALLAALSLWFCVCFG